jgi:hypothetical protein
MPRILSTVFALALLSGCDPGGNPTPARVPDLAPAYRPVANVKQTMEWILDPAADVIWDSAGFVITAEGETDLAPTTDEGWEHVRNSAAVLAETGNLLMMPGRAGPPDWVAYAQGLTAAGEVAMAAAEAHDADALFDAGGQVYQVCRACHEQYLVPLEDARSAE